MKRSQFLFLLAAVCLLLAGCRHGDSSLDASERVLKQDLLTLRHTIDQYTVDRKKAPQSLTDLVQAGYLRAVPKDPITGKSDWVPVQDDSLLSADQTEPGISDVHSASDKTASDGTAYSSW